jgi:hypothetical protein
MQRTLLALDGPESLEGEDHENRGENDESGQHGNLLFLSYRPVNFIGLGL